MRISRVILLGILMLSVLGALPAVAGEWLPGYTNQGAWVKKQLDQQKADAKTIDGKKVGLVFLGDSITCFWRDKPKLWQEYFSSYTPLNLGIGADNTEHIRWRLENGKVHGLEPEGLSPKAVVLMAGTNNLGGTPEKRAESVGQLLKDVRKRWPKATVVLMSITPRGKGPADKLYQGHQATNPLIKKFADGKKVIWCDLNALMTWDGKMSKGVSADYVHYTEEGYRMWGDILTPVLKDIFSPSKKSLKKKGKKSKKSSKAKDKSAKESETGKDDEKEKGVESSEGEEEKTSE